MSAVKKDRTRPRLDWALAYARIGIPVFPLASGSKIPTKGSHGFVDATTDPAQITAWWTRTPGANIGAATGYGHVVIDEDTYKGADVAAWCGPLPVTRTTRTPSGGRHLWFTYDEPIAGVPENALAHGILIRARGGYVVLPPSTYNGNKYTIENGEAEIARLPEHVAALIRAYHDRNVIAGEVATPPPATSRRRGGKASADSGGFWLDKAMARTSDGNGDVTGFWLAQQLLIAERNGECSTVRDMLTAYAVYATQNERDPFDDRDVDRWLRSAENSQLVARGEPAKSRAARSAGLVQHGAGEGFRRVTQADPDSLERPAADVLEEPAYSQATIRTPAAGDGEEPPPVAYELGSEADDNGNAEFMRQVYGRDFLYTPAYGWLEWARTHWRAVPDDIVTGRAIDALKKRRHLAVDREAEAIVKATKQDKTRVTGCTLLFRTYVIEPDATAFDADPDLLNCANGALDLRTGEVTPHDSAQRFTYCVPVAYEPNADYSEWAAFILDALGGDADAARYLQTVAGYTLTGHTNSEKMFYLFGPTRAGKGTTMETLLRLLPHPLGTGVDFSTFTAKRDTDSQNFDLAELRPARLIVASESNKSQSLNPAKIKQLTGGDPVRCAFKHKDMFTYKPHYKVWLVSNHRVNGDPDDKALWGRVHVFEFPTSHLGAEDIHLKTRLSQPASLRGVLAWAAVGARRWYAEGLQPPESVTVATEAHRAKLDYVGQWYADACTPDPDVWTASGSLMTSYTAWCENNGQRAKSSNDLAEILIARFGCAQKRQAGTGNRGFMGIRLGVTP